MRTSFLFHGYLVLGLAFIAVSAPAADKPKSKPKAAAPAAAAAATTVSPELKAFEKALNDLGPATKAMEEGSGDDPPAQSIALLEKLKAVSTDKLPADLKKDFTDFCSPLADLEALIKAMPANLTPAKLKKWLEDQKTSDPAGAKHIEELMAKVQANDKKSDAYEKKLNWTAKRHGLNLRPFLRPDSIGRELLKPAGGKTTTEKFVRDLEAAAVKRKAVVEKQKEKSLKTMADIAAITREHTALVFEIPADGLPEDLAAAFSEYREMFESYSWRVTEFPGDVPIAKEETGKFILERMAKDADIGAKIKKASANMKKGLERRTVAGLELVGVAKTHNLDIAKFLDEQISKAKP